MLPSGCVFESVLLGYMLICQQVICERRFICEGLRTEETICTAFQLICAPSSVRIPGLLLLIRALVCLTVQTFLFLPVTGNLLAAARPQRAYE